MSLRRRITRLENGLGPSVPLLSTDGTCYAAGVETTEEAWRAQYAEQIEREQQRPPDRIFVISFAFDHEPGREHQDAPEPAPQP